MNRTRTIFFVLYLSLGLCSSPARAQNSPDHLADAANTAYQAKEWLKAEPLYAKLTELQPDAYLNWYRLGVAAQALGQHERALDAFKKAQAKGLPVVIVGYKIAAVYASVGKTDSALSQLAEAVKQGYNRPDLMSSDPDFLYIRGDARFAAILDQAKQNQTPCDYKTENRQFDFWVGDWEVAPTSGGPTVGISHVERALGDCVIWENWTSLGPTGSAGKSYNVFNPDLKRWEQFWVDNVGGMIHFYGALDKGVMDFYTDEIPQADGKNLKRHLQFFNLGPEKVRQFSQGSNDGGKTWFVEYDFTYDRKK